MTTDNFAQLTVRQAELIEALDAGDADAILCASDALALAVAAVRDQSANTDRASIEHGLKLADSASRRINYLSAWNRQKIDRLAELRGQGGGDIYAKPRICSVLRA